MTKVAEEIVQSCPPSVGASVVAPSLDAAFTAGPDTAAICIREVNGPDRNSLAGALASAIVHMFLQKLSRSSGREPR